MRNVLFYTDFNEYSATMLVSEMIKDTNEDLNIKLSSNGGQMRAGLPCVANMVARKGKTHISVEGCAYSFGAAMLLYADRATATSLSEGMIHSVSYPSWYKPTVDDKKEIEHFNKNMREAIDSKLIDGEIKTDILNKFDKKRDRYLSAADMLEVGLISEIIQIDTSATNYSEVSNARKEYEFKRDVLNNYKFTKSEKMDLQQLKTDHSDLVNQVAGEERNRITKLLKYSEVVPELVNAKIEDGSGMDEAFMDKIIEASMKKKVADAMEEKDTIDGAQREAKNEVADKDKDGKKEATAAQTREMENMKTHECTDSEIKEYKETYNIK